MIPAATAHLLGRAVVRVTGPEARPFLNRLLTQEVETLGAGELRFGALLTPQGRVLHDVFLWGEAEGVTLDVAAGGRDDLLRRLAMFRLRAAVEIAEDDAAAVRVAWGAEAAAGWRRDPRAPEAGWRTLGEAPAPQAAREANEAEWTRRRFALGLVEAADGIADRAYATEADLDLLHGVDFSKGCFVGQETTSRMKRRGGVRSRVLPLGLDGGAAPSPGAEVLAGELRAGEVTAVAGDLALALLRLDRVGGALTCEGRAVQLRPPPWLPAAALAPAEAAS